MVYSREFYAVHSFSLPWEYSLIGSINILEVKVKAPTVAESARVQPELKPDRVMIEIQINDEVSLFKACDLLHDAELIVPESTIGTGTFKAYFKRLYLEDESLIHKRSVIPGIRIISYPLVKCVLSFEGVKTLTKRNKIDMDIFNEVRKQPDGYHFVFSAISWIINFHDIPKGYLKDLEFIGNGKHIETSAYATIIALSVIVLLVVILAILLAN
jgi:hypothetical protein